MTDRENLFAYTELPKEGVPYVGYLSLNREKGGSVTLSVRSPGDHVQATCGTITPPIEALRALGEAARFEALRHKDAAQVGD